ncbi:hypothetical protein ACSRUE_21610 [Sorangium sp. KYC3313]|uniref:hypothetical protein n=1 Tax=Sorangium sp. KYC3313 TaxID=3449740 RepID=UPI003F8AB4B7
MFLSCMRTVALLAIPLVTTACIGAELDEASIDEASEEAIGEAEAAVESNNGIFPNAIGRNALTLSSFSPRDLSLSALSWGAFNQNVRAALQNPGPDGAMSRQLVQYVVSCALRQNQSLSFTWTDSGGVSHPETYTGFLGMADWWVYGPLTDPFYQRYITACLAARTNWYGVSVQISLRASQTSMASSIPERWAYLVREGAFWGNVFSTTPYVRACYSPPGVARARALQRDCAAGHLGVDPVTGATITQQCGPIEIVGSCDTLCGSVSSDGGFYSQCLENPAISSTVRTDVVITSFLPQ